MYLINIKFNLIFKSNLPRESSRLHRSQVYRSIRDLEMETLTLSDDEDSHISP